MCNRNSGLKILNKVKHSCLCLHGMFMYWNLQSSQYRFTHVYKQITKYCRCCNCYQCCCCCFVHSLGLQYPFQYPSMINLTLITLPDYYHYYWLVAEILKMKHDDWKSIYLEICCHSLSLTDVFQQSTNSHEHQNQAMHSEATTYLKWFGVCLDICGWASQKPEIRQTGLGSSIQISEEKS